MLEAVGRVLREGSRQEDLVARIGGEEFAVVVTGLETAEVVALAERYREAVAAIGRPVPVTASIGACVLTRERLPALDPYPLFAAADRALYASKNNGRNQVTLAQPDESGPGARAA